MQSSMPPLRRTIKNVVNNYTEPQIKVREATSNDPWGPSSSLMAEISDMSYNAVAFSEIMQMVWKRLNDHGKNWRHVYKALTLMDYLVKTGSEKVADQCRENIFAIQTLKDFVYVEDNKDQGVNVREKAKQLTALLNDEDRLKNERAKALRTKEKFAGRDGEGFGGSDGGFGGGGPRVRAPDARIPPDAHRRGGDRMERGGRPRRMGNNEMEAARPATYGEEELQLQLALAISREEAEADQKKKKKKAEDAVIDNREGRGDAGDRRRRGSSTTTPNRPSAALLDLDMWNDDSAAPPSTENINSPGIPRATSGFGWSGGAAPSAAEDPWGMSPMDAPKPPPATYAAAAATLPPTAAPLLSPPSKDDFKTPSAAGDVAGVKSPPMASSADAFDFGGFGDGIVEDPFVVKTEPPLAPTTVPNDGANDDKPKPRSAEDFLGVNSSLVNLDSLVSLSKPAPELASGVGGGALANPFALTPSGIGMKASPSGGNPFASSAPKGPPMNQMKNDVNNFDAPVTTPTASLSPMAPLAPMGPLGPMPPAAMTPTFSGPVPMAPYGATSPMAPMAPIAPQMRFNPAARQLPINGTPGRPAAPQGDSNPFLL